MFQTNGNGGEQNLMDHVFNLMETYAETLEKEVGRMNLGILATIQPRRVIAHSRSTRTLFIPFRSKTEWPN